MKKIPNPLKKYNYHKLFYKSEKGREFFLNNLLEINWVYFSENFIKERIPKGVELRCWKCQKKINISGKKISDGKVESIDFFCWGCRKNSKEFYNQLDFIKYKETFFTRVQRMLKLNLDKLF